MSTDVHINTNNTPATLCFYVCSHIVFLEGLACFSEEAEALVVHAEQHNGSRCGCGSQRDRITRFGMSLIEVGGHLKEMVNVNEANSSSFSLLPPLPPPLPLSLSLPLSSFHFFPTTFVFIPPPPCYCRYSSSQWTIDSIIAINHEPTLCLKEHLMSTSMRSATSSPSSRANTPRTLTLGIISWVVWNETTVDVVPFLSKS